MTAPNPLSPYRTIDAAPVRAHLHSIGVGTTGHHAIAGLTGVSAHTVKLILHGRRNQPQRAVQFATAQKILAVTNITMTDSTGSRRRIRSLHCDGYDTARISAELDVPVDEVHTWLRSPVIATSDAARITDLHERWAGTPAETNGSTPADADAARAMARRRRWYPADYWDGDIDDPDTTPVPADARRSSEDLVAKAELVRATTTYTWAQIAKHLGVPYRTLDRARSRVAARRKANGVKATEHLPAGRGAPGIGLDLQVDFGSCTDLPPETNHLARRTVAARAVNADDARHLLEVCGLIGTAAPQMNRMKGTKR